jgi:hypothetical protein
MTLRTDDVGWLWVVVQLQSENNREERLVGQQLAGEESAFIPAFRSRDEAEKARPLMALAPDGAFEIQAIQREQLRKMAGDNGFFIRVVSETGQILEEIPTA